MPKERQQWRSRRDPPRKANDWKRNRQQNQSESKAHSQQNKAKTPRTAGSYQMYLGHRLEVPEEEVKGSMEYQLGTAAPPHHIRIPDHENVPQPMRPKPDPGNIP